MEINKRNRTELKNFFVKNAIPTEGEFADLIDGMVNQKDDGFAKLPGNPLSIEASGDEASQKKAVNFYKGFTDANPSWVFSLNPRSDPKKPATAKPGFSISDHAGNSRFFIDESTGNVGLGTVEAEAKLDVMGDIRTNVALISDNPHGQAYAAFSHRNQGAPGGYALLQHQDGETYLNAPSGKNINFRINDTDKMRLLSNGNVGIGTATPGAKLDILAQAKIAGGWYEAIRFSQADHSAITHPGGGLLFGLHGNRNFYFGDIKDGAFKKYVMQINADSGEVSIPGTLSFGANVRQMINLWKTNYGVGIQSSTQYFRTDKNFAWYKSGSHNNDELNPGGGTVQMVIKDGNVCIGANNPGAKLDVRGNIFAGNSDIYFTKTNHDHSGTGNTAGYAAIENANNYNALMILGRSNHAGGKLSQRRVRLWDYLEVHGTFVNSSDGRSKKDIEGIPYGLKELNKLKPISFNWKDIANPHKSLGFVAQEVKPVIHEVVYSDTSPQSSDEPELSVSYTGLIPVLVNAIKELDAKVENLLTAKARI